ncbi:MAG: phosphatase PAP2 family protein [Rhodospirillales bacterium]|nr:phosphatase PAP2 family protein [Rhodospirillales bacterium]
MIRACRKRCTSRCAPPASGAPTTPPPTGRKRPSTTCTATTRTARGRQRRNITIDRRQSILQPFKQITLRLRALGAHLDRNEVAILGWSLGLAVILLAFFRLADEVMEGDTHAFDRAVLLALRNPRDLGDPIGPIWLEIAARDITSLGGYAVLTLVALAAIGFLFVVRKRQAALLVFFCVGGGMLLSTVLKKAFDRPRPELVPHAVEVFTLSFPSGHAMLSAATYLTLGALLARVQPQWRIKAYLLVSAVVLTVLIGCSRVYLGVHWPTDVLAGWCAGSAWAIACWLVALALQRRGHVESDGDAIGHPSDITAPSRAPAGARRD